LLSLATQWILRHMRTIDLAVCLLLVGTILNCGTSYEGGAAVAPMSFEAKQENRRQRARQLWAESRLADSRNKWMEVAEEYDKAGRKAEARDAYRVVIDGDLRMGSCPFDRGAVVKAERQAEVQACFRADCEDHRQKWLTDLQSEPARFTRWNWDRSNLGVLVLVCEEAGMSTEDVIAPLIDLAAPDKGPKPGDAAWSGDSWSDWLRNLLSWMEKAEERVPETIQANLRLRIAAAYDRLSDCKQALSLYGDRKGLSKSCVEKLRHSLCTGHTVEKAEQLLRANDVDYDEVECLGESVRAWAGNACSFERSAGFYCQNADELASNMSAVAREAAKRLDGARICRLIVLLAKYNANILAQYSGLPSAPTQIRQPFELTIKSLQIATDVLRSSTKPGQCGKPARRR